MDATPERLAKGDESVWVNPAEIDSAEQPIGLTRRFRKSHLDRLYRKDDDRSPLTWRQWHAGDWYRDQHERCRFALSVIGSYGERTTGGQVSYGLPRSEAQLRARRLFMEARRQWPAGMVGFMDRLLLHDELPRTFGGTSAKRNLRQIRAALDALAAWLDKPLRMAAFSGMKTVSVESCARTASDAPNIVGERT